MPLRRDARRDRFQEHDNAIMTQNEPDDPHPESAHGHHHQQRDHGPDQASHRPFFTPAGPCGDRQRHTQQKTSPPRRNDAPTETQQRRRLRLEDRRVPDREIFNAHPSRNLIVKNPVKDGRADTQANDGNRVQATSRVLINSPRWTHPAISSPAICRSEAYATLAPAVPHQPQRRGPVQEGVRYILRRRVATAFG